MPTPSRWKSSGNTGARYSIRENYEAGLRSGCGLYSLMNRLIIGVGSNIDPVSHISGARAALARDHTLVAESHLVRTEPIGITDQASFTNGAFLVETALERPQMESYLKELEDQLGRDRSRPRFGPRTIDLDIVAWNGRVVDDDYYTRDFLRDAALSLSPDLEEINPLPPPPLSD